MNIQQANECLEQVVKDIRVPKKKYEEAREHYNGVASWLDSGEELKPLDILVFPQGSFAQQTAIRPIEGNDYDVDLVCLLRQGEERLTPAQVKMLVGRRLLDPKGQYRDKVDPAGGGRRCWTIKYAENKNFHLDILPAVPDRERRRDQTGQWNDLAIKATDRMMFNAADPWTYSNPQGFAKWLAKQGQFKLAGNITRGHRELTAEVDPFPNRERINPVQGAIQILKRDRDSKWKTDKDKPISVIITTIVGQVAGDGREGRGIAELLKEICVDGKWQEVVECRQEKWWVQNPVHERENFADKWQEKPRKQEIFMRWMGEMRETMKELLVTSRASNARRTIEAWVTTGVAASICTTYGIRAIGDGGTGGGSGNQSGIHRPYEPKAPTVKSSGSR